MRIDYFMIIIGILLILAMVLTLRYGGEASLHGYGSNPSVTQPHPLT